MDERQLQEEQENEKLLAILHEQEKIKRRKRRNVFVASALVVPSRIYYFGEPLMLTTPNPNRIPKIIPSILFIFSPIFI